MRPFGPKTAEVVLTFNKSRTPTSATAAPRRPSGARFTHAATSKPITSYQSIELSDISIEMHVPPFEPPLIATLPLAAYLF